VNPNGDAHRVRRASMRIFASGGNGATCAKICSKDWSSSDWGTLMIVVT